MKKTSLLIFIILSNIILASNSLLLKAGFNLEGKYIHNFCETNYEISEVDEEETYNFFEKSYKTQGNQLILGIEYNKNFRHFSLGAGITKEQYLKLIDSPIRMNYDLFFIPIYGSLKYYIPFTNKNIYLLANYGINFPISNYENKFNDESYEYIFDIKHKSDIYYSYGLGLEYENGIFSEINYSVLKWKEESHYLYFYDSYYNADIGIDFDHLRKYSHTLKKINIIFGYKFDFKK